MSAPAVMVRATPEAVRLGTGAASAGGVTTTPSLSMEAVIGFSCSLEMGSCSGCASLSLDSSVSVVSTVSVTVSKVSCASESSASAGVSSEKSVLLLLVVLFLGVVLLACGLGVFDGLDHVLGDLLDVLGDLVLGRQLALRGLLVLVILGSHLGLGRGVFAAGVHTS